MKKNLFVIMFFLLSHWAFASFEGKPISARISGMGETFSAVDGGVDSIFYTPVISGEKGVNNQMFASYSEIFDLTDLKQSVFAYNHKISPKYNLGLGFQQFGNAIYNEETKLLNFSSKLFDKVNLGINIKNMNLKIESLDRYSALGIDGGLQVSFSKNSRFGFAVKNFNRPEIVDNLPVIYRSGLSFSVFSDNILWAFDWEKEESYQESFHLGQEIILNKYFLIRTGYQTQPSRLSAGFGFIIKSIRLDYSIVSHSVLGETQLFSFIFEW